MKRPIELISFEDIIHEVCASKLLLADVLEKCEPSEWKDIVVRLVADYDDPSWIQFYINRTRPNPNYANEVRIYEAYEAKQRADKLAIKMKAREELEERLARINEDIEEMNG